LARASLAEVVRLYGLRMWVEQSYKQVKQALGWAEYEGRSDLAMRRHWMLVWCAFAFCWWQLRYDARERLGGLVEVDVTEPDDVPGKDAGRGKTLRDARRRQPPVCWPAALRTVRAWLEPWLMLGRYWRAWSPLPHHLNSRRCSPGSSTASRSISMSRFDWGQQSTVSSRAGADAHSDGQRQRMYGFTLPARPRQLAHAGSSRLARYRSTAWSTA
jgi:hypothetical protein